MEIIAQTLDEIVANLGPLKVEWQDETATRVIDALKALPLKASYTTDDLRKLLDEHFNDALLIFRLFLGLSQDQFRSVMHDLTGGAGIGRTSYKANPDAFIEALLAAGLLEAMTMEVNRKPHWSDILIERLRSGRGSAIAGQRRGRGVEDFAEAIIAKVFPRNFEPRCTFTGPGGKAKCDFAIPNKEAPRIVVEAKGYGATGSKMTDIIGDVEKIITAKRPDTAFLFFTDGLTWKQRKSDLRKIVEYQNKGGITRIYTSAMAAQFEADLWELKGQYKIQDPPEPEPLPPAPAKRARRKA